MRRVINFLLCGGLGLTLVACGGTWSDEDLRFYASLPDRHALESKLPQDAPGNQQALIGELSPLLIDTRQQARSFNEGLQGTLDDLERITSRPPTRRAVNLRIWGPALHPASRDHQMRMLVRWVETLHDEDPDNDDQPDHFEHALQLRRVGEDDFAWQTVIGGAFVPGSDPGALRRGSGFLVLNVDGLRAVGLPTGTMEPIAQINMGYDTSGWPVGVAVTIVPVDPTEGALRFSYLEGERGGGIFRFVAHKNLVAGPGIEDLVIASAWLPSGPGRANVLVSGGDLARPAGHEECWDALGVLVFERDWMGRESGRRLACPAIVPPEPTEP